MVTDKEKRNSLLIVDDENSNLKVLSHILGSEYAIYTATNGKSAIEKAKEYRPDLILLDILMPIMDGYQTLAEIKNSEEIKGIPVIFITGLSSDKDEEKGLSLDAADYITKPFSATTVKLRVRNQIQLVRLHRDLKAAVKDAEAANRSKSVFLAKMSDEIRTPLNAIMGFSEIQLNKDSLAQDTRDAFTTIFNSGNLLLGIINDILDFSMIEAGKLEIISGQYNFENMINDVISLNVNKYGDKPVKFILNADEKIPSALIGDVVRIKQILNNLLSNAFKYTAAGEIELSITLDSSASASSYDEAYDGDGKSGGDFVMLVFRMRDTGQGMTAEHLEKLFDDYSRFNTQSSHEAGETSLGMNILKNLLHMMNGSILAESKPGKGSVFTVRLPQGSVGAPALGRETVEKLRQFCVSHELTTKKAQIVSEPLPSGKVLIVDDIDINLYVTREMLLSYGLQVDTAISGAEAIEKIKQNDYNIVFMDHIMPGMDGIETTLKIRKLGPKYENIPIIALTANAVFGVKDMFLANGFNDLTLKPLGMHELNKILKEWMRP